MKGRPGKLDARAMKRAVFSSLGGASSKVVLGPGIGLDNAVLSVGNGRLMLLTTDPVSIIPEIGIEDSAWLSVHLIASDYATSGLLPEFATFTFNLPVELDSSEADAYLKAIGSQCKRLGVTIVAGHTGSYPGGGYTVVGGGSMFGFCKRGEYVDPTMARRGDAIVMTKGAAIEAAAMLAHSFPEYVESRVGRANHRRAKLLLGTCSTVNDAVVAASAGLGRNGVTSMHDATEGGVLGGLGEMADAAGKAFVVERKKIYVSAAAEAVCAAFDIDPLSCESEGTLLLTCNGAVADELLKRLGGRGIPAFAIGNVKEGSGLWLVEGEGAPREARPRVDGYWRAYERSIRSGLK